MDTVMMTSSIDSGFLYGMMGAGILITLVLIVSSWKIFEKAGQPGWASIVPVYSFVKLLEIVRKPWWWFLLLFIPIVGFFIAIKITHLLSQSFGKGVGYTIGLLFLPFIFLPMLAFGSAVYQAPKEKK